MKFICSSNNFKNLHIELPKETMVQSIPQDEDYDSDDTRNNSIGELQNVAEHNLAAMQVQEKVYKLASVPSYSEMANFLTQDVFW